MAEAALLLRRLALLAAVTGGLALTACSAPAGTSAAAPQAAAHPASAAALGGKPPLARAGERLTYRISIQGVELAEFAIEIGADDTAITVQSVARSTGVGALLKKVETHFASYIDPRSGRPMRFMSEERAGRLDATVEQSDAHIAEARDGIVPVSVRRGEAPNVVYEQEGQKVRGEVWDLNSLMIALRQFEAPIGTTIEVESFRSRFVWRTQLTVAKHEQLTTELGRVATLRFDGRGHGLRRDGALNDEPERRFSLWVSDDADRVPVLLVGVTDYGDIRMEITSYTPPEGNGTSTGAAR
jgi:Protein of unknown function (DUF3108)